MCGGVVLIAVNAGLLVRVKGFALTPGFTDVPHHLPWRGMHHGQTKPIFLFDLLHV